MGHFFIYVLIGFILALVYTLEQDELTEFWDRVDRRSLGGTLGRWLGHVADATIVTVQLQSSSQRSTRVIALPVLLVLGVPNVGPLMLLIFVSALVPVIGNIVSGVTLWLLAYQAKGWLGVGIFVALTFILHKVESYYLSPRLTSRHVKIPGFLLIVSLLRVRAPVRVQGALSLLSDPLRRRPESAVSSSKRTPSSLPRRRRSS